MRNPAMSRIAAILLANRQHLSAEQILARLHSIGARVSKATVYNTLNLFAAKGLLRQLTVDPDVTWFDSNTGAHFHVQHVETGALMDVDPAKVSLVGLPPPPEGTEVVGIEVVVRVRSKTS